MIKNFIKQKRFEMGLRMKNFNIMGVSLKNPIFRGGFRKTNIQGGNAQKGGFGQFPDLKGGGWQKRC